jgi:hypothetical protein
MPARVFSVYLSPESTSDEIMAAGRERLEHLAAQEGNPVIQSFGYRRTVPHDEWTEYEFEWVVVGEQDPLTDLVGEP